MSEVLLSTDLGTGYDAVERHFVRSLVDIPTALRQTVITSAKLGG